MVAEARAHLLLLASAALVAGCGGDVPFECQSDEQCVLDGSRGRCERTGYCSFPDEACKTGWRYGELAESTLVAQCVVQCVLGLSLGTEHSCALLHDGAVACWGNGKNGRLGDGSDGAATPQPVTVSGMPAASAVSAGGAHSCALAADDGTVWCWGANKSLQLGVPEPGPGPVRVTALDGAGAPATQVSAGGAHSCARASVGTGCWGNNTRGQLGNGSLSEAELPSLVEFNAGFQDVAAGDAHTCGRTIAGTVHCFGDNKYLQVGGTDPTAYPTPTMLQTPARAAQVDLGLAHGCMVTSNETVDCWGNNQLAGQLSRPQAVEGSRIPLHVELPAPIVQVSSGATHSCALDVDGRVWCWGGNEFGQLGPNGFVSPFEPEPVVVELPSGIVEIAVGWLHSCARTAKDEVYCWGANEQGQLGNGETNADGQGEPDETVTTALCRE